ncbi:MAG: hypothetical protein ACW980_22520 [Promethearchaeota archaeon]
MTEYKLKVLAWLMLIYNVVKILFLFIKSEGKRMKYDIKDLENLNSGSLSKRAYCIYPQKGVIIVDGFKCYDFDDLIKLPLNTKLSFAPVLFEKLYIYEKSKKKGSEQNEIKR